MAGLIALFDQDGKGDSLSELTARFPSHAAQRDEWRDRSFAAVRLHHGKVNAAPQPHWDETGNVCVFMDGHLYDDGEDTPGPDAAYGAAATCLRAYQAGPEALARLNGNFALIVYDKERQLLTLVSDQLNTRPLYYFQAGRMLAVSSHVAALTAHPRCPKTLSRQALHELITYRQVFGKSTIYNGIHRMDPGSIVTFNGALSPPRSYWRPEFREPGFSRSDAPEILLDGFRRAAQRRLSRNARHGVLLSGGLDSRAILASAGEPLPCFTIGHLENQQVQTAKTVAEIQGAKHRYLPVDPDSFWSNFDEAVSLTGGMYGCQQTHFLPVLKTMKQDCDVVFIGHNMDSFFRGAFLPARKLPIGKSALRLPVLPEVDSANLVSAVVHGQKHAFPWALPLRILTKTAADQHELRIEDSVRDVLTEYDADPGMSPLRAWDFLLLQCLAQRYSVPNVLCIRSWMDEDVLVWDRELVELYLQMPPEWRHPDAVFRTMLKMLSVPLAKLVYADTGLPSTAHPYREAASVLLIKSLRRVRRKLGGRVPATDPEPWLNFDNMLRQKGPLRERVEGLAQSETLEACGIFDQAGLANVTREHLQGERNVGRFLLMLLTIDSWIRQFGAEGST